MADGISAKGPEPTGPEATPRTPGGQVTQAEGAPGSLATLPIGLTPDALAPSALTPGARRPLDFLDTRHVRALQFAAGNAAVAQLLHRETPHRSVAHPALAVSREVTVSRSDDASDRQSKIDKALNASPPDAGLVKDIDDFSGLPYDTLIKLARILVYHYEYFFGPRDRSALRRIFDAFGAELGYVAQKDPFLFEKTLKEWPGLMMDIPAVDISAKSFKTMISSKAKKNLDDNIAYLDGEYTRMWGASTGTPEEQLKSSAEQNARATAMQAVAAELLKLRKQQNRIRDTKVGFKYNENNPFFPTSDVTFRPDYPPKGNNWYEFEKGPKWDDLNAQWSAAVMLSGEYAARYPWLFGILKDPENAEARLQAIVNQPDAYNARAHIQSEMQMQLQKTKGIKEKWQEKEPDWYELVPVYTNILDNGPLDNFDTLVGRQVVEDHKNAEWWKDFALEAVTDAAILVVSLATAGAAPLAAGIIGAVVAAGVPAAQAAMAYDKAQKLGAENQATVLPTTDVVSQMQVDAARAEALAKTIEAVLTLVLGGVELAPAARLELKLARLAELALEEQAKVIASAVTSKGSVWTAERTGLTLGQIASKVGTESEAGMKIAHELADILRKPASELSEVEKAAIRDISMTAGSEAAKIAAHELEEPDYEIESESRFWEAEMPIVAGGGGAPASVQQEAAGSSNGIVVQRAGKAPPLPTAPPTWGPDFERYAQRGLLGGEYGLPQMTDVFAGQYNPQGWGIDIIGLEIDEPGRRFRLYQFECKYVRVGAEPVLGRSASGLQTSTGWTSNAVDLFLRTDYEPAVAARNALLAAVSRVNGGRSVDIGLIGSRLTRAHVGYIVPEHAVLERFYKQVAGIARWRNVLGVRSIPIPE